MATPLSTRKIGLFLYLQRLAASNSFTRSTTATHRADERIKGTNGNPSENTSTADLLRETELNRQWTYVGHTVVLLCWNQWSHLWHVHVHAWTTCMFIGRIKLDQSNSQVYRVLLHSWCNLQGWLIYSAEKECTDKYRYISCILAVGEYRGFLCQSACRFNKRVKGQV